MRVWKPFAISVCLVGLLSACGNAPETRQFEIRVDDEFYTVTETKGSVPLFGGNPNRNRTVRVAGQDIPCPDLPCAAEIRQARGANSIDEARLPPPGADLTTE